MVQVLGRGKKLEELHLSRRPSGHVKGKLLQHGCRAFAAAKTQSVGYLSASAECIRTGCVNWTHVQQVANIRHDPFGARLDEPVFIEVRNVLLNRVVLL